MRRILVLVMMVLAITACGDTGADNSDTSIPPPTTIAAETTAATEAGATTIVTTPAADAFPVTVQPDNGPVTIEQQPQRIAALSATHVEMLFAMGAEDQLIAGDLFSNYPAAAAELTPIDSFNLSVESVIALDPDLVVLSFDPVEAVPALEAVGIPTLLLGTATSLGAAYAQMETLGSATGHDSEAAALVAGMQEEIAGIVEGVGDAAEGVSYYHESDPFSFYTPNSSSFIGQLYGLLGMENIADAAPDDFDSGFPQLSPEYIIDADVNIIFLATEGEDLETVAARDGWDTLTAVQEGRVVVLDADVSSRWGPRITQFLAAVADAVTAP